MTSSQQKSPGRIVRRATPPASPCAPSWTEASLAGTTTVTMSSDTAFSSDGKPALDDNTSVTSSSSYQNESFENETFEHESFDEGEIFDDIDLLNEQEKTKNVQKEDNLTRVPLPAGDIGLAFQGTPPKVQLVTDDSPLPQIPVGSMVKALSLSQDKILYDLTTPSLLTALYESRQSENRSIIIVAPPEVVCKAQHLEGNRTACKIGHETCFSRIRSLIGLPSNSFSQTIIAS